MIKKLYRILELINSYWVTKIWNSLLFSDVCEYMLPSYRELVSSHNIRALRRWEYPEEYWSFCTLGRVISLRADVWPNHSCIAHVFMSRWSLDWSQTSLSHLSRTLALPLHPMWIMSYLPCNETGQIGWPASEHRAELDMVAGCSTLRAISIITQQSNHCGFLQLLISADNQPVFWSVLDPQGWTGAVMRLIATNATEVCSERIFRSGPAIWRSLYRWEEKKTCPAFGSVLSETLWRARMPDILTTLLTWECQTLRSTNCPAVAPDLLQSRWMLASNRNNELSKCINKYTMRDNVLERYRFTLSHVLHLGYSVTIYSSKSTKAMTLN